MSQPITVTLSARDLASPDCRVLSISDIPDENDKKIFRDVNEKKDGAYYVIDGTFIRGGNHARWRYTEDGKLVFYCKYRKKINKKKMTKKGNWEEAYFGDDLPSNESVGSDD